MAVKGSKDAIIEKRMLQKDEILWFWVIMIIGYWLLTIDPTLPG